MWRVFAEPELSTTLDDRVALVATQGHPGVVGSTYELAVKFGPVVIPQMITVRESVTNERLEAVTEVEGKVVAVQLAEFVASENGTELTWTVTMQAPKLMASATKKKSSRELEAWLEAADAVAARLL